MCGNYVCPARNFDEAMLVHFRLSKYTHYETDY